MIGEQISHYRIIEKLGQGGIGEVYLAEDTRLGRKVALKFLALDLTRDHEALVRLRNEARAAAELSHSNIATIHGFEEGDGTPFLVLEYLPERTGHWETTCWFNRWLWPNATTADWQRKRRLSWASISRPRGFTTLRCA